MLSVAYSHRLRAGGHSGNGLLTAFSRKTDRGAQTDSLMDVVVDLSVLKAVAGVPKTTFCSSFPSSDVRLGSIYTTAELGKLAPSQTRTCLWSDVCPRMCACVRRNRSQSGFCTSRALLVCRFHSSRVIVKFEPALSVASTATVWMHFDTTFITN